MGTNPSNANPSATRPNDNHGRVQPAAGRGHGGRNHPPVARVAVTRAGVRNYSSDKLDRMLQCICTVLPTGNQVLELVALLHATYFPDCNRNAVSIKKKFYQLANKQPTTGNPTILPSVALGKKKREDINAKAGVTDADVPDLFDDGVAVDDYDEDVLGDVADNKTWECRGLAVMMTGNSALKIVCYPSCFLNLILVRRNFFLAFGHYFKLYKRVKPLSKLL
jgi:hypothetical protein